ncbi:amphoterin-induced protein 2 [Latimeria chalumnae]|uniref:amphoterin-induced protein 2 n=1 Tax=Latimeria chalumnae TaxID=7897 RepID=UPI0003C197B3|nr:PREDICTED: amphoterin-induced protein 2 [Latimeria chalumnae]|eukprot:XP_005995106.1 PREDICTED: amphoterin-induced protein 2 [Latimeria chalumnae]
MFLKCQSLSTVVRNVKLNYKCFVVLLAFCVSMSGSSSGVCPTACICASDIITCSNKNLSTVPGVLFKFITRLDLSYNKICFLHSNWTSVVLIKLNTLVLSHNSISTIFTGAFSTLPNLRYLDLSCNNLKVLNNQMFQSLKSVEVLLLYSNQITHIDSGAFGGLYGLQKLYLSHNFLTQIPFELYTGKFKLPAFDLLDISFNSLKAVSVQQISRLPARQQSGLYLQGNPFLCDCTFYTMITYWYHRQLSPVVEFKNDYSCFLQPDSKSSIKLFPVVDGFMNCSDSTVNGTFHAFGLIYEAQIGERLVIHCDTKIHDRNTHFLWVSPNNELIQPGNKTENMKVFLNGSLEIRHAQFEDSGVYYCFAVNNKRLLNETVEVTIKVSNFTFGKAHPQETFSTAFTTLAACLASIILVLLYLYLTPCRCWCKARRRPRKYNQSSAHSSILNSTPPQEPPTERKASAGKKVVFMEPIKDSLQVQNGKIRFFPNQHLMTESILKTNRTKSDSDSISSVFSDTPFIA